MKAFILFFVVLLLSSPAVLAKEKMSDAQVRQQIIHESILRYPGNCPCPYSRASNGYKCGKRSAWSKPGGYTPICYPNEISDKEVKAWRQSHAL
ncbi:hypothetical protein [Vibrio aerogenes]|uniref:hypothetical protein n=1 Tax=Vibrio aerogenes TaxID=92172 RepID=UPI000935FA61|nr:hypothetical protein [Vibrio aerogenes]